MASTEGVTIELVDPFIWTSGVGYRVRLGGEKNSWSVKE